MTLRVLSYLAPSVPASLFEALATRMGAELGEDVALRFDESRSGPRPGEDEPFTSGRVDLAFLCATSYVWLSSGASPVVDLVGAAWVPADPRSHARPVYFADVVGPASGAGALEELVGGRVAYNDEVSLSGYHSLRFAFDTAGIQADRIELVRSGSHLRSLELLRSGDVDAAALDSTVWQRCRRHDPALAKEFRVISELGPHPVQPMVARAGLPQPVREAARRTLVNAHAESSVATALGNAELVRFVAVDDRDYAGLRAQMADLGWGGSGA